MRMLNPRRIKKMSKSMYGTLSDKTVLPQPEPRVRPRTTPSLPTVSPSRFVNGMYKTGLMAKNSPDSNFEWNDEEYEAFVKKLAERKAARLAAEAAAKAAAEKTETVETVDETPAQPEVKPEPVEFTTDYSGPSVEVEDKPDLGPVEIELPKLDEQPAAETAPKKKERKKKADAE
jgi:hypothetical protein